VTDVRIGVLAGLATAGLWVVSGLSFTKSGQALGATRVNLLRTVAAAVVLCGLQWFALGRLLPGMSHSALAWLSVSGVLGLTIGDQFLFTGYVMLGPRLVSVLMTLAPSMSAMLAWSVFGESMSRVGVIGMLITTAGVAWAALGRAGVDSPHTPRERRIGLMFGVAAALCQAAGMVAAKRGLDQGVQAFDAQTIRMYAGALTVIPLALLARSAGLTVQARPSRRAFAILALGVVSGPLLGVYFSMLSQAKVPVGVAATLIGLVPVLILPATRMIDGERITVRACTGAVIAVAGIVVLSMGASAPPDKTEPMPATAQPVAEIPR
jgi:drug/metabolite transporter (DMT)-like permease